MNRVIDTSISEAPEGAVNSITLTLHTDDVFTGEQKQNDIIINKMQVPILLEELKKAYAKMNDLSE